MAGGGTTTMPLGGTPLSLQRWQGVALAIRQGMVVVPKTKRALGIITNYYKGGTTLNYKRRTTPCYKGGTSVCLIAGTSTSYNVGADMVCSLLFFYLFSHCVHHTQLQNIQIFAILVFSNFFRFKV